MSRNIKSSFSETTALKSYISFWIDASILLYDSKTEKFIWFFVLILKFWWAENAKEFYWYHYSNEFKTQISLNLPAWILRSRSPSTTFCAQKFIVSKHFFKNSIYHFCATLTQKIAVLPRLWFFKLLSNFLKTKLQSSKVIISFLNENSNEQEKMFEKMMRLLVEKIMKNTPMLDVYRAQPFLEWANNIESMFPRKIKQSDRKGISRK